VIGTIGVDHQFTKRREALPPASGFYIDISQDADHNADVQVGDPGAFVADVFRRGDRIIGKCLDDRVGCAIQVETMRRVKAKGTPHSLYFAFTVQEEVGVRGAAPAAFGIEPDFAIAIDATPTGDVPHTKEMAVSLGDGAAIKARDNGLIVPGPVKDLMVRRAQEAGILFQIEVLELGSTDGKAIQNVRAGVPTGAISFPVRYVHTTSETADLHDIEAAVRLLVEILTKEITL
jgi:putative aminopeptidase FrvX